MSRVTPIPSAMLQSSIWRQDPAVCKIWMTMLMLKDSKGIVEASVGGLADAARVSIEDTRRALHGFLSPDPDSKSKNDEGRRIREVARGWLVINHEQYAALKDEDGPLIRAKIKARQRQSKRREKKRAPVTLVTVCHAQSVTKRDAKPEATEEVGQGSLFQSDPPITPTLPELSAEEKARAKRLPATDASKRIAALFRRRLTTAWHPDEVKAFKTIGLIDPYDLDSIEAYYATERAKGNDGIHRRDLGTFLNNFAGELDRARLAAPKGKSPSHEDPPAWREFLTSIKRDYAEYRFAPGFLRSDFGKWRPAKL